MDRGAFYLEIIHGKHFNRIEIYVFVYLICMQFLSGSQIRLHNLGDNCIQHLHLGEVYLGYIAGNLVFLIF